MHDRVCCLDPSPMFGLLPLPGPVSSLFAPLARRWRALEFVSIVSSSSRSSDIQTSLLGPAVRPATLHACGPRPSEYRDCRRCRPIKKVQQTVGLTSLKPLGPGRAAATEHWQIADAVTPGTSRSGPATPGASGRPGRCFRSHGGHAGLLTVPTASLSVVRSRSLPPLQAVLILVRGATVTVARLGPCK